MGYCGSGQEHGMELEKVNIVKNDHYFMITMPSCHREIWSDLNYMAFGRLVLALIINIITNKILFFKVDTVILKNKFD